jgi:2-keto-4-pentenoate hydratase/2-oxohepta-3-ene-1,7-dioic acid hydratase in catechol pathway
VRFICYANLNQPDYPERAVLVEDRVIALADAWDFDTLDLNAIASGVLELYALENANFGRAVIGQILSNDMKALSHLLQLPMRPRTEWENKGFLLRETYPLAPLPRPTSFRDFYAFEQHVKNARKKRGLEMVPEWYDAPVFYFSNTASIVGPGAEIRKPPETNELDYELELAVVIGKEGCDIPVAEADDYILGFTILNDWSARDIQRREMKVGLGPAKGKDFATSIGPYLVTPDELEDKVLPDRSRGKRYDILMTAQVNGF